MFEFELVTPPAGDVVTLAEVKADLRIDTDDFDAELTGWIAAAVERLEDATRRQLLTATWRLYLDQFPRREIPIWKAPTQSVEAIEYVGLDGELVEMPAADYVVSPGDAPRVIVPAYGTCWPPTRRQPQAVRIQFVAGYGEASDVPAMAKGIIKVLVRGYFSGCEMDVEPLLNHLRWTNQRETEIR